MIADIHITEKSFGAKSLMKNIKFSVDDGEKIGVVGRNGVGKSTLFGIISGQDTDFTGDVIFRRGRSVVSTAQEHLDSGSQTVLSYVLEGLPEYTQLKEIIDEYPMKMGDNLRMIHAYTEALERFDQKGFYQVEERIERELDNFQLHNVASRPLSTLSGGQKRLVEVIKVMHSDAHLALLDEPTNHMDYVAKAQFIDWMKSAREAMLIVTHDRDVLAHVDRIIELKDGESVSYRGNYDAYLQQNALQTAAGMNDFEHIEKRIANLKQKVIDYQRLKEKSRNPSTIQRFKRLEQQSRQELAELEMKERPSFWIDRESVAGLDYKAAGRYDKFKARTIRLTVRDEASRSKHVLVRASDVALGYGETLLFEGVSIDLREGEAVELRGRNGAGKTTLIAALLSDTTNDLAAPAASLSSSPTLRSSSAALETASARRDDPESDSWASAGLSSALEQSSTRREPATASSRACADVSSVAAMNSRGIVLHRGDLWLDPQVRVGVYEQEIDERYLHDTLEAAIEKLYLARNLPISDSKIRQLCADYLFIDAERSTPLSRLSGGQRARFQIIAMLANDPQLLILDEPTNHLDLPSIEELESALARYSGAILYVSHDTYFRQKLGGSVVSVERIQGIVADAR